MFVGDFVNIFIGLSLLFATVALIVSTLTEALATMLRWRSANLIDGLKSLLNDKDFSGLAGDLLTHAGVNPTLLVRKDAPAAAPNRFNAPSYIDSAQFAAGMIDALRARAHAAAGVAVPTVRAAIDACPDDKVKQMLQGMYSRAGRKEAEFHQAIASWFDASMDRVGGAYKRHVQLVSFCIALAIAMLLNFDAFAVADAIWRHPEYVVRMQAPPAHTALQDLDLSGLPIGWSGQVWEHFSAADGLVKFLGMLTCALAALFGAPFWFDLLQKFVRLRGSGTPPKPANQT
jgi:hypothetical protein